MHYASFISFFEIEMLYRLAEMEVEVEGEQRRGKKRRGGGKGEEKNQERGREEECLLFPSPF